MKRFKHLVIGGIQNKIFNLILITVVLLTAANTAVYLHHSSMLSRLAADSGKQQQQAIGELTSTIMDAVVTQSLQRSNQSEAKLAAEMFEETADRVSFLADYATQMLADAEHFTPQPYEGPNPDQDGTWTAKVIFAPGTDPSNPELVSRIGLFSNMSDIIISLCKSHDADNAYIAFPQGAHYTVSEISSSWFADGQIRSFDPRTRAWYQQAVEAGQLVFTEGEWDAITGVYCIECAAPVYDPEGNLAAVIGADLFLDDMQKGMQQSLPNGEYQLLISRNGHAVLAPQAERFPMAEADRDADLRNSQNQLLSQIITETVAGKDVGVMQGELEDGSYYITASGIEGTGWVLISAFSKEVSAQPITLMQEQNQEIQTQSTALYLEKTKTSRYTALALLLAVMMLMLTLAILLGRRIVLPLNTITTRISELSESNLEFKMEDAYRTGDEVEELAQSFANISHKTVEYLDAVKRVTAEKERISAELSLATKIQAAMLPHIVPAFPDRKDFDIIGSMDPAKEVGGDFYDYFLIDDDHLCMVMADVSGKGVPAALFMMASKIILQSVAMLGGSPAEILTKTNQAICSNNEAQMFVTVWVGIVELSTGKLTAANAGHEYPVFKRPDGNFEIYKDKHGFAIGGMDGVRYKEYELQMTPGSKLFVYTDGVPEATNAQQELFGMERMLNALNEKPEAAPMDVLKNVRKAVDGFVMNAEQFDDLTMLCMEYKGPKADGKEA